MYLYNIFYQLNIYLNKGKKKEFKIKRGRKIYFDVKSTLAMQNEFGGDVQRLRENYSRIIWHSVFT